MRLHTLRLEAFGPFPDRVDVDFDELDQGILLVNGPTGSGKSSLLDAVAFALFGDVPGSRRSLRNALRSHHAAPETAPWVELEFSVGPERWRVRRAPAWDAPKRRGSGTTTRPASVRLERRREGQWHLVSSRIDEAADMVTDTLGMGLEQFAQVVLLPQGEFAQFLRAKPEDRRALLERLFDVARFEAVERWFAETKNERLRASEASLEHIRGHMTVVTDTLTRLDDDELPPAVWSDESVADLPEVLRTLLAALRGRRDDAGTRAAEAAAAANQAERAVERAGALLALREAHERARTDLDSWPAETVTQMKNDADAADHVAGVLRLAQRSGRADKQLEQARARRIETAGALAEITGLEAPGERHDADAVLPAEALKARSQALQALQLHLPRALRALDDVAAARRHASAAEQKAVATRETVGTAKEEGERADEAVVVAEETLSSLPDVRGALNAVHAARRILQEVPAHSRAVTTATEARDAAVATFTEREHDAVALRLARLAGISAEIATDLTPGNPCPVCGSCEHPNPATSSPQAPGPQAIEAAERAARDADEKRRRAEATLAGAEQAWASHLAHLQARLDDVVAAVPDGETSPAGSDDPAEALVAADLVDDDSALRQTERDLNDRAQRREEAAATLEKARSAQTRAHRGIATAEKDAAAAVARRDGAKEALAAALQHLAEAESSTLQFVSDYTDSNNSPVLRGTTLPEGGTDGTSVVATATGDDDAAQNLADEEHEEAVRTRVQQLARSVDDARRQLTAIDRARDAFARADATFRTAATQSESAHAELSDELVAKGYDDVEAAFAVALDEDELTSLRATWQHAIEVRAAAGATLADDTVVSAAHSPAPDPARLRRRADIYARRANESSTEASRWARAYEILDSMRDRIADAVREHLPVAQAAREMSDLASTFSGIGENTHRMRLTSYVLAAHLETVTAMANERLHHMTDGRYQLKYTDERAKGTARSGLGLVVVDAWTGRSRDTATLSGGEAFMASLALALGLGDAVRADSGGMELHTLFVDEGFGSLDQDTLEQVMEVLDGLREGGRLVGVVSHVTELRARIPSQIEVRKTSEGSTVHPIVSGFAVSGAV